MADHEELIALTAQLGHFDVHLVTKGQVASNTLKTACIGLVAHRLADTVGAEDQGGARRHFSQVFNEDGAFGLGGR